MKGILGYLLYIVYSLDVIEFFYIVVAFSKLVLFRVVVFFDLSFKRIVLGSVSSEIFLFLINSRGFLNKLKGKLIYFFVFRNFLCIFGRFN